MNCHARVSLFLDQHNLPYQQRVDEHPAPKTSIADACIVDQGFPWAGAARPRGNALTSWIKLLRSPHLS